MELLRNGQLGGLEALGELQHLAPRGALLAAVPAHQDEPDLGPATVDRDGVGHADAPGRQGGEDVGGEELGGVELVHDSNLYGQSGKYTESCGKRKKECQSGIWQGEDRK